MKKDKFKFIIDRTCNKGGVKEACYVVREYLSNSKADENGIFNGDQSAVSNQEFLSAVESLLAFSWSQNIDIVPEMYLCDNDCSRLDTDGFCPGEFQLSKSSEKVKQKKLCPHFIDSSNK
jgi:hypothetical protein